MYTVNFLRRGLLRHGRVSPRADDEPTVGVAGDVDGLRVDVVDDGHVCLELAHLVLHVRALVLPVQVDLFTLKLMRSSHS